MITRKNLNDRQRRLLGLLTTSFERQPTLNKTTGVVFYPQLRADVVAAGATDGDFECLAEHLIGLIVEHTGSLLTSDAKKAQLDLDLKSFCLPRLRRARRGQCSRSRRFRRPAHDALEEVENVWNHLPSDF